MSVRKFNFNIVHRDRYEHVVLLMGDPYSGAMPLQIPTLNALTLSSNSIVESAPENLIVGSLIGLTAGSTVSLSLIHI